MWQNSARLIGDFLADRQHGLLFFVSEKGFACFAYYIIIYEASFHSSIILWTDPSRFPPEGVEKLKANINPWDLNIRIYTVVQCWLVANLENKLILERKTTCPGLSSPLAPSADTQSCWLSDTPAWVSAHRPCPATPANTSGIILRSESVFL